MKRMLIRRATVFTFALLAVMLCSSLGFGQALKIDGSDGRWVSVGAGLRSSFNSMETVPGTYSQNIALDNLRVYINAEVHKDFQLEINTEGCSGGNGCDSLGGSSVRVLDAVAKYQPNEQINIWMGRHLVPTDRANLDGPYYQLLYTFPSLVSQYGGLFDGRDNGISASGKIKSGKATRAKWAFGIYEGMPTDFFDGGTKHFMYAGRVTVNLMDAEDDAGGKSGYYTASTYYGQKDQILTLGFSAQTQQDVVSESGLAKGFTAYDVDLLYERKLKDKSVVTFEGAYHKYNVGRYASGFGIAHGSAFMLSAAYLFPLEVGRGKFQPVARYQDYVNNGRLEIGTNYIIRGHSARLSFLYTANYFGGAWQNRLNGFSGGTQFQF